MRLTQESRATRLETPVRALDPLLLLWIADCRPCIGPTLSLSHKTSIVCLPESSSQLPLPKTPRPPGFSGFAAEICRGEVCVRGLIATVGMLRLRKVKNWTVTLGWVIGSLNICNPALGREAGGRKSGQRHSLVHGVSWQPPHPPCYCRVLWTATLRSLTRCPSLPWPLGHVPACGALRAAWKFQVSTAEVGKQISWWKSSVQVLKLNWNYFEEWESQNPRIKRIQEDIRHGKLSVLSKIFLLVNHTVVQQAWQQTPVIPLKIALMQYFCK